MMQHVLGNNWNVTRKMPALPRSQRNHNETVMLVNKAKLRVNMEDSPDNYELQWDHLQSILQRFKKVLKKMERMFRIQDL